MSALSTIKAAAAHCDQVIYEAQTTALRMKGTSIDIAPDAGFAGLNGNVQANRNRYSLYRGWLYSAVHALALEASGQECRVARIAGATPNPQQASARPSSRKSHLMQRMPKRLRTKAAEAELEMLLDHPLLDVLEQPNPVQGRVQFVYAHTANINLTGESYVVADTGKDSRVELYALPTTWIRPVHDPEPFAAIRIIDPKKPSAGQDTEPIPRGQFARAYLPNPSDPLAALAPAMSQAAAIRIDDNIQTSQDAFFDNGIFPSVIVTVGKKPHPDVPAGIRPTLTATQRRQVHAAIRKVMGGVSNYGEPAIVDGLIENIQRLSATQNEMGWDKSEDKVADRILSAFGVHKFILGLQLNVGGYAQAYGIRERFYARVNCFTDMLGSMLTSLVGPMFDTDERLLVWWEELEAKDPQIESAEWREARKNGDITRNEYRARLGLPPDDRVQVDRNKLLDSVGGMQGAGTLLTQMGQGMISSDTVARLLALFFELPLDDAQQIVGGRSSGQQLEEATDALERAIASLGISPAVIAGRLTEAAR